MRTKKEIILSRLDKGKTINGCNDSGTWFCIGRAHNGGFFIAWLYKKKEKINRISHISALMPFVYRHWYNLTLK